jgi:hypothetical protein
MESFFHRRPENGYFNFSNSIGCTRTNQISHGLLFFRFKFPIRCRLDDEQ